MTPPLWQKGDQYRTLTPVARPRTYIEIIATVKERVRTGHGVIRIRLLTVPVLELTLERRVTPRVAIRDRDVSDVGLGLIVALLDICFLWRITGRRVVCSSFCHCL